MKRQIKASSLTDLFLQYHENAENYNNNRAGFDKMYSILDKYDTSNGNDSVDVVFEKATPEDQERMIELIRPKASVPGQDGYALRMYYEAMSGDWSDDRSYNEGIVDAFEALFEEGIIDESTFRTDL